jgi:GNAT superfamily N-acetyltransferase
VVAAAYTGPPRTVPFSKSFEEMGINIRKAGMAYGPTVLLNPRMKTLGIWLDQMESGQPLGGNYFYISMFATAPEYQGNGCGSALLAFLGEVADTDGVVSYLETAGLRNTTFYTRKGVFNETKRSPVANFTSDGGGVAMLRQKFGGPKLTSNQNVSIGVPSAPRTSG